MRDIGRGKIAEKIWFTVSCRIRVFAHGRPGKTPSENGGKNTFFSFYLVLFLVSLTRNTPPETFLRTPKSNATVRRVPGTRGKSVRYFCCFGPGRKTRYTRGSATTGTAVNAEHVGCNTTACPVYGRRCFN